MKMDLTNIREFVLEAIQTPSDTMEIKSFKDILKNDTIYLDKYTKILAFHYDGNVISGNIFYLQEGEIYSLTKALKIPYDYITDEIALKVYNKITEGSIPKMFLKSFNLLDKNNILYLIKNDSEILESIRTEFDMNLIYVIANNIFNIIKLDKNGNLIITAFDIAIPRNENLHEYIKAINDNIFPMNRIDEYDEFRLLKDEDIKDLMSHNFIIFRPLLVSGFEVKSIPYRRFDDIFVDASIDQVKEELKYIIKSDINVLAEFKNANYIRTSKTN